MRSGWAHCQQTAAVRLLDKWRHDNQRRQEQYVEANWDVIELVYDRRAKSLDGAVINGEPCNEANKDKWCPLVPFTMKVFVLGQVMAENEIKNG